MTQTNISTWLNFALQQMAAESYLDQLLGGRPLREILLDGNNDTRFVQPDANGNLPGKTRFTNVLADRFLATYDIVDHHANDATGFSATLLRDTTTGEYTLSFRSLEYQNQVNGGDWERDGLPGAAGEIAGAGFALGQLVSMERYYQELKTSGKLPDGATLNVTGYSLGGHLATVFTELHSAEIQQTYTFNAAGRGLVGGVTPVLTETDRIRQLIETMEAKFVEFDPTGALLQSGASGNIYQVDWYQQASVAVANQFQTTGTANLLAFPTPGGLEGGVTRTDGAFSKITQLFGHALTGHDAQGVANSGVHGPVQSVLMEGQPLLEDILNENDQYAFGNTHGLTLLVDSLALTELFQQVDPNLTQAQIEDLYKAASAIKADAVTFTADAEAAEGDTLEKALDALRKVVHDPTTGTFQPTSFGNQAGDFGSLAFRNEFYAGIEQVRAALTGQTYQIDSLVGLPASTVFGTARQTDVTGMAYRFALKELSPFVVRGADYSQHNQSGELDLHNVATGQGAWTLLALSDRTELLAEWLKVTVANGPAADRSATLYEDQTTGFNNGRNATATQVVIFGDAEGRELLGRAGDDHIYGGEGDDVISGLAGQDYLGGGADDDMIDGGSDNDILLGQQGNDHLFGEADNDRLNGRLKDAGDFLLLRKVA